MSSQKNHIIPQSLRSSMGDTTFLFHQKDNTELLIVLISQLQHDFHKWISGTTNGTQRIANIVESCLKKKLFKQQFKGLSYIDVKARKDVKIGKLQ